MEGACWYRSLGSSNTAIVELILPGGNCGNLTVLFDTRRRKSLKERIEATKRKQARQRSSGPVKFPDLNGSAFWFLQSRLLPTKFYKPYTQPLRLHGFL